MSINSVCSRKAKHRTRACAEKAVQAIRANDPPCLPVTPLIVYKCPHCDGWHVGHKMPKAVTARERKT